MQLRGCSASCRFFLDVWHFLTIFVEFVNSTDFCARWLWCLVILWKPGWQRCQKTKADSFQISAFSISWRGNDTVWQPSFDLSSDTSSSCGNVDVDVYQNSPWNFSVVLCINLEGLHCLAWFFSLLEKFVSGQCWCSMQGLPLATQQLLVICQRVLPKARQYPVQSAIYIYLLHFKAPHLSWSIQTYPRLAWRCWWNSCVAASLVLLCKSISFNSLLNHQSMQSIRKVFDPYIFELPSNQ